MSWTLVEMRHVYDLRRTWLKRRLREEGQSQSGLARQVGVSPSTISRILAGQEPTFGVWIGILEALEVSP